MALCYPAALLRCCARVVLLLSEDKKRTNERFKLARPFSVVWLLLLLFFLRSSASMCSIVDIDTANFCTPELLNTRDQQTPNSWLPPRRSAWPAPVRFPVIYHAKLWLERLFLYPTTVSRMLPLGLSSGEEIIGCWPGLPYWLQTSLPPCCNC